MTIPLAELHVHLEGTITPTLALKLAERNKLTLPPGLIHPDGQSYQYNDFLDFLKAYDEVANLIKHPRDYYDLTFDYLKASATDNCIYVEMMYSPDHAEFASKIPSHEHLQAIQQAINDAKESFGITARIIITAVRHYGADAATNVVQKALKEDLPCITGFGLGGDEINFPPKLFKTAYKIAADAGLSCTVHAGEFNDATSMTEAINHLPIKRIGHGVQAIHSLATIELLKDRNISLEVCPSSNISLGLFENLQLHPLPKLLEAGVHLSLGSDDPPFFRTSIGQEYQRVQAAYQYNNTQMLMFTKMALTAAFVDEKTRSELLKKLEVKNTSTKTL